MRWLGAAAMLLSMEAGVGLAGAQSSQPTDLAQGKLLVASPDLPDPNFAKTVVLLVQYDDEGVLGLILNRRLKMPVSRVLEGLAGAKERSETVFAGGPVERADVLALVRSRRPPGDAKRVLGDVFLVSSKEGLEKTLASDADTVHIYLGYSGWTAAQLEHELELGAWYIFQGTAKAVFDSDPDELWPQLIHETEMRIASRGRTLSLRAAAEGWLPRD